MIGVSIVTYRSPLSLVEQTLKGVAGWHLTEVRVHIHANASSAQEAGALQSCADRVGPLLTTTTSWSADNLGFAEAHNRGLDRLFGHGCAAVFVHNPDLVLSPAAPGHLVAEMDRLGPGPLLLGPLLELADPATMMGTGLVDTMGIRWTCDGRHLDEQQGSTLPVRPSPTHRVAGISGACLLVTRSAHEVIVAASGEFFDEAFIAYREDAELAYRAQWLGVSSYVCPGAHGRHARRLRGTTRGTDVFVDRLGVRNRFLIAFKYGRRRPGRLSAALARDVVVVMAVLLTERSSLGGLREAWVLRHVMSAKGARIRARPRPATRFGP